MPHGIDDHVWDQLTEDEQRGIADEADDDAEGAEEEQEQGAAGEEQEAEQEGDDDGADDEQVGEEDDDEAGEGEGDDEPAGDEDDAGEDGEGEEEEPEPVERQPKREPLLKVELPDDIEDQFKQIATDKAELRKQFEDGDISVEEYEEKRETLDDKRQDLRALQREAELSDKMEQSRAQQDWQSAINDFVTDHPIIAKNETMWSAMDSHVRKVNADPANANLSGPKRLKKAYEGFVQEMEDAGFVITDKDKKKAPSKKEAKADEKPKAKTKKPAVPNIGAAPAAQNETIGQGRFAELDRLFNSSKPADVAKAEDMMAKMSEAEQNQYLRQS